MIDYKKDAENWGESLNDACWTAIDSWENHFREKIGPTHYFHIKPFLREVILSYLKNVEECIDKTA